MLSGNKTLSVVLSPGNELEEVVVTADLNSPLHTTQTGKISLTAKDLLHIVGGHYLMSPTAGVAYFLNSRSKLSVCPER